MKKTIRLTENDLSKLVKRIINEEKDEVEDMKKEIMGAFRKVSMPDFEKGTQSVKNKKISQIKSEIKDILSKY